jgi:hypothetical protein
MDNATPEGNHMTMSTFKDAIEFFNNYGGIECIITGGEPTENPQWLDMLEYAMENVKGSYDSNFAHITLTTNGMNISGNKQVQSALSKLLDRANGKLTVQVTHVDEYYPIKIDFSEPFFSRKDVVICNEIEYMYPLGRARENKLPWKSFGSKCFNIRSIVRSTKNLRISTLQLAARAKFCTPRINWNGDIKLGESRICPSVATIWDSHDKIVENIYNFKCDGCKIVNQSLKKEYLQAIGEE